MNINILVIISCICMLFIIGRIFIIPIRKILQLVFNSRWCMHNYNQLDRRYMGISYRTEFLYIIMGWNFRCSWCNIFNYIEADFIVARKKSDFTCAKKYTRSYVSLLVLIKNNDTPYYFSKCMAQLRC